VSTRTHVTGLFVDAVCTRRSSLGCSVPHFPDSAQKRKLVVETARSVGTPAPCLACLMQIHSNRFFGGAFFYCNGTCSTSYAFPGAEISSRRSWVIVVLHKGRGNLSGTYVDGAHQRSRLFELWYSAYLYAIWNEAHDLSLNLFSVPRQDLSHELVFPVGQRGAGLPRLAKACPGSSALSGTMAGLAAGTP
jgi:hypothetical protein